MVYNTQLKSSMLKGLNDMLSVMGLNINGVPLREIGDSLEAIGGQFMVIGDKLGLIRGLFWMNERIIRKL